MSLFRREFQLVVFWIAAALVLFAHDAALQPAGSAVSALRFALVFAIILWGAFAVVRHAEALAHRLGEPYGTLVLTIAVTLIEVAFIVSAWLKGHSGETLARDTVFAVMMITLNGIAGLSLLLGALRHGEQEHNLQGTRSYLAVIVPVAVLALVLPNYTTATPGPTLSVFQCGVFAVLILLLYGVFLVIQTRQHREFFVEPHASRPRTRDKRHSGQGTLAHAALLVATLLPVIYLTDGLADLTGRGLAGMGAPAALAGVIIAALVLAPEGLGGLRAATANELQRSLNITLGSALATVGLTIPTILIIGTVSGGGVLLGLAQEETLLLLLTFLVMPFTFGSLRTNVLVGAVHCVLFAVFVALLFDP